MEPMEDFGLEEGFTAGVDAPTSVNVNIKFLVGEGGRQHAAITQGDTPRTVLRNLGLNVHDYVLGRGTDHTFADDEELIGSVVEGDLLKVMARTDAGQ